MGCVYFVRHGETVWNVENKICGSTDIDLTQKGHEQAIETGKKILNDNIKADKILYSPLIRAKKTAMHISEITGIPAFEEPRLTEQNFENLRELQETVMSSELPKVSLFADMTAANLCCTLRKEFIICLMM